MLNHNNDIASKERAYSIRLTVEELNKIVDFLNIIEIPLYEKSLIQRFIYEYENATYWRVITNGLWATEFPDELICPNNNKKIIAGVELPYLFKLKSF